MIVEVEKEVTKGVSSAEKVKSISSAVGGEKEARALDVLWLFKPCTLSN